MDDLPPVFSSTNFVFDQCGLDKLTLDQFRAEFCLPFKGFYDRYAPNVPMEKLEMLFHGHFKQVQDDVVELPHARDFLEFCRQHNIRTFLLSTVRQDHYTTQANSTDLAKFIDKPYVEIHDKRMKIHDILAENNLLAHETIFIGDMQHDVETAKHGGVFSCAVLTGYNRLEQLRVSNPDVIVEHLGELRDILTQNKFATVHRQLHHEYAVAAHPISTVGALIYNAADEVLMIRTQKWSGMWGIPGGKIKLGEPSIDALKREIKEETNLDVGNIEFVLAQDCIHSREFYRDAHFILLNYTCRVNGSEAVTLNEEAQEFRWLTLDAAAQLNLNKPTRILLDAVKANRKTP